MGEESIRLRCHAALGDAAGSPLVRALTTAAILVLIVVVLAGTILQTVPTYTTVVREWWHDVARLASVGFLVEYALRLWCAVERFPTLTPAAARLRYARSFFGVVDGLVAVALVPSLIMPDSNPWATVAGLLPLVKISRYAPGLDLIASVFRSEGRTLAASFTVMSVLLVIASGIMFALEHEAQPEKFASIPHALWWGVVTMATVGYGDVVPHTLVGRVFGTGVIFIGIALFAVPAGIFATGFTNELKKRDFILTWQSVARVPLFSGLDASRIAAIGRLLTPQFVPAGSLIVRRGESAKAMYFIMSGDVVVDVARAPVRLRTGDFFGEIALLKDMQRTASVLALTECQLLVLGVADFRRLIEEYPDIRDSVGREVDRRLGQSIGAVG